MMSQDRFPTASGSKDKKEKKSGPLAGSTKTKLQQLQTPPRSIKHTGRSTYEKLSDRHVEEK